LFVCFVFQLKAVAEKMTTPVVFFYPKKMISSPSSALEEVKATKAKGQLTGAKS
jgi:hypothetical protein